jgi:hypothetical protein
MKQTLTAAEPKISGPVTNNRGQRRLDFEERTFGIFEPFLPENLHTFRVTTINCAVRVRPERGGFLGFKPAYRWMKECAEAARQTDSCNHGSDSMGEALIQRANPKVPSLSSTT